MPECSFKAGNALAFVPVKKTMGLNDVMSCLDPINTPSIVLAFGFDESRYLNHPHYVCVYVHLE